MHHEIGDRLFSFPFSKSQPLGNARIHTSSYLIQGERKSMLIDTGAPSDAPALLEAISRIMDPAKLDYIFLTHLDVDHMGGVFPLLERAPKSRLVGSMGNVSRGLMHDLPRERFGVLWPGETLELGNRAIQIEPAFLEDTATQWLSDPLTGTYFTSDVFGVMQFGGTRDFADELEGSTYEEGFLIWQLLQFPVVAMMEPSKYRGAIEAMKARGFKQIAPAHGPVVRRDVNAVFDLLLSLPERRLPGPPPPANDEWKIE